MYLHIHHVSQERYTVPCAPARWSYLVLSLTAIESHPSSAAFDVISQTLQGNEADRKDALDKAKAIVAFNLKNDKGEEAAWYLDLKNKGEVGQGLAPQGGKADGEFPWRGLASHAHTNHQSRDSHPQPLRCRLRTTRFREGQRSAPVHGWQAEDQGQHHEGDQNGAYPEEGPGCQAQAVDYIPF